MDIEQDTVAIIRDELHMEDVELTDHLRDNLGVEQIDRVCIFMELEAHFNIVIPEAEELKCETVQDCVDCVTSLL